MKRPRPATLAAVLVLLIGVGVAAFLARSEKPPQRRVEGPRGVLVETITAARDSYRLVTEAQGTVVPARRVQVQAEVGGRIVEVHSQLVPGGVVRAGKPLFRIDPREYRLAVAEQRSAVEQAKAELALERGRQAVAEQEWELFRDELPEDSGDQALATRQPQLAAARAALQAARDRLQRARLNLERTVVAAPFDAFVEAESAAVGQLVSPQTQVVTLVGTDRYWLRLAVPVDRIPFIAIPGVNAERGAPVRIRQEVGGRVVERRGQVLRLEGRLNPEGRMARLLVEIPDPLNLEGMAADDPRRGLPLLIDAFVSAVIQGPEVTGLIRLPRAALREGGQAYVYQDGRLAVRELEVVWRQPDAVLVKGGLEAGERVIVSPLAQPFEGMALRLQSPGGQDGG